VRCLGTALAKAPLKAAHFKKGNKLGVERIETQCLDDCGKLPNYNPSSMSALLKSLLFKYLSAATIVTAAALSVSAQKPKPSPTPLPEDPQGSVRIPIRRVRLPITVTDKKGNFVPGLTQNDFMIMEDKVPQSIETFSDDLSQTTPLYIAVLMDTSPSTAGKLKFQQESAMNFIQTVVKPRKDRVLFGTFDDQINLLQDFTDKLELLDKAVYSVKKMGKQTALFDAVWQFCDEKMRSVPGRRAIQRLRARRLTRPKELQHDRALRWSKLHPLRLLDFRASPKFHAREFDQSVSC